MRFSISREKWSLTGEVVSGISRLHQLNLPYGQIFVMGNKLGGTEQWTKKDCRRGKNQESRSALLVISGIDRVSLSFPVKVAILQEGTGLIQEEEL